MTGEAEGAADVVLELEAPTRGPGGTLEVPVVLDSSRPLWGFEFTVRAGPGLRYLGVEGSGFDYLSGREQYGEVRVGAIHRMGLDTPLPAGRHAVAKLLFGTAGELPSSSMPEGVSGVYTDASWRSGRIRIGDSGHGVPGAAITARVHPNPFAASARIHYALPREASVRVAILDVSGRRVRGLVDGVRGPGEHETTWDGRGDDGEPAAAGIYFVKVVQGSELVIRKLVLLR